ncbi:MAG TPA: ribonuclease P protein component [Alphaproteobacteria bacterium]|nr:ribonuclease P protein component [Alphaproteobacteria bacterium]HOO50509.1 ribonuclease P protein component [Alphaproteobacteria bacterium]
MKATKETGKFLGRLKQQAAFDSLRKSKLRWVSKGFALQAIPRSTVEQSAPFNDFCVIASKKTAKSAVVRNRMRRRLKTMAQDVLPECAKNGYDFMIVARREALTLDADILRRDLQWCLKRLELLKQDDP